MPSGVQEKKEEKKRLDSWKEIASYLGRDQRTAIRWSKKENGLPVHRVPGSPAVFAWTHEVDAWLAGREPSEEAEFERDSDPIHSDQERGPQGLKPGSSMAANGTLQSPSIPRGSQGELRTEAVPFPKTTHETGTRSDNVPREWVQRWWPLGAVVIILLLAWPAVRRLVLMSRPVAAVETKQETPAPLDPRHFTLSQGTGQRFIHAEAFFDDRPSNPNRRDGSFEPRNIPSQIRGLGNVVAMAGGQGQTLAVKSDGTLWFWGWENTSDDYPFTKHSSPIPVHAPTQASFRAVAAGGNNNLALASDGTVWAWGGNGVSQLGDGTTIARTSPVSVAGLGGVVGIAARQYYSLALKNDGTVWIWGGDELAKTILHSVPTQVPGLEDITAVSAG